jgi:RHS repeat-associated protein
LEFFINGRGERLEYKYDNKDLLTYAAGTFYTHDQNGNILTVYNENGTTKREYDKNDRVTKFTDVNGNAIGYTYDEAGNLIKLTYPAGEVVSYAYDALNRLATVTDYNGRITKYEYDKNSRLVKTTRPDGSIEEITYDRAGRMTAKIDKAANGEIINQYEYTYNTNGDIIEEKDLQGNRTTPIKAESTEMTYGAANRLESVNGQVVSYDADGNMIKGVLGGGEASFGYDKFNRLIRVSAEGTENAENTTVYKYDGEGNRISVTNNGEIIVFVTDPTGSLSNLLESRNIDGSKTIYVYGVGLISQEQVTDRVAGKAAKAAQETTTEYRLFHYDYRGSTTALTNASGNVTDKVVYSPYGKIDERTGETETRFLYVGQFGVQVDKNGLYYMRARYYNVDINRFIQEDSIRDGLNWYAYANNNPIMFVDLWGLEALVVSGGAFNEEEGGNIYQFTFVDSSLLEMSRISSDRTTLLVANAGWTKTQYEAINKYAEDNNINLVWFSNTDELTNYINTKSVSGIGEDRSSDLITSFSVFSHGTDYGTGNYAITFGYGSKTTINLYTDNISQIDPLAFAKNSVSYFYACRTGSTFGITWYGYPYDKENFAQAWANRTNGIVYAIGGINGRSTYADILGKKIEKHLLERLKKGSDSLKKWYTVRGNIFISPGIAYKLPEPVLGGFWYVFSSNSRPEHVPESQLYYQFE